MKLLVSRIIWEQGIEMKLLDFTEYARVAQLLWDRGMVPQSYKYLTAKLADAPPSGKVVTAPPRLRRRRVQSTGHRNNVPARRLPGNATLSRAQEGNVFGAPVVPTGVVAPPGRTLPQVPYNGTIFLTTEDPAVIDEANAWGERNHWAVVYTNLFDR